MLYFLSREELNIEKTSETEDFAVKLDLRGTKNWNKQSTLRIRVKQRDFMLYRDQSGFSSRRIVILQERDFTALHKCVFRGSFQWWDTPHYWFWLELPFLERHFLIGGEFRIVIVFLSKTLLPLFDKFFYIRFHLICVFIDSVLVNSDLKFVAMISLKMFNVGTQL